MGKRTDRKEWDAMDIVEVLGVSKVQRMRGEFTQERAQITQSAWDAGVSLIGVGLKAVKTFGRDISDSIGQEIRTAIENLDGVMVRYLDHGVDVATMKAVTRQAHCTVTQIGESFKDRP